MSIYDTEYIVPKDAGEPEWSNLFQRMWDDQHNLNVIIGKRIREFHDEVISNPKKWGNWTDVCRRVVHRNHSTCSEYETVYRVYGSRSSGPLAKEVKAIIPDKMYTQYLLARAIETGPEQVKEAIKSGKIHADMEQKEAREFLDEILELQEEPVIKKAKSPLYAHPGTKMMRIIDRDIGTMTELYGDIFTLLVEMRRDHPDAFGAIEHWDKVFPSMDVTTYLKILTGDKADRAAALSYEDMQVEKGERALNMARTAFDNVGEGE